LPRFERPVAIVTTFLPLMVNRIERLDHQRLFFEGDEIKLAPPGFVQSLKLTQLFREWFNFEAEWAIQTTGEVLLRTDRLAKSRGARAIFVTPYLATDWPRVDSYFIDDLLVRPGLTVVNPRFNFQPISSDDGHPDVASTRRLADAIIASLKTEIATELGRP